MFKYFDGKHPHELKICPTCQEEVFIRVGSIYCFNKCIRRKKGKESPYYKDIYKLYKEDYNLYQRCHAKVWKIRGKANSCMYGCWAILYHWANLTGNYEDVYDYVSMCQPCHIRFDNRRVAVIIDMKGVLNETVY